MNSLIAKHFGETLIELSQHQDLDKISTTQIIKSSGLGRQTFYNHFRDKYQLIAYIFHEDVLFGRTLSHTLIWQEIMAHVFTAIDRHRPFYQQAFKLPGQNSLKDYIRISDQELYTEIFKQVSQKNLLNDDMLFALGFYSSGCFDATLNWLTAQSPVSAKEHARQVWLAMPFILKNQIEV